MATVSQDSNLEIRLNPDQRNLIEEAASLAGEPLTSFAAAMLVEGARRVIDGLGVIRLSDRDWDLFLKLLDDPPEPNDYLKRAAQRYQEKADSR